MSNKLEELKAELEQLSADELRLLISQIEQLLKRKNEQTKPKSENKPILPSAFRITLEEVEDSLLKTFTPEELAEAAKVDLSKIPPLPKTITEYISEDREDRC
jgi:hypothetical protein